MKLEEVVVFLAGLMYFTVGVTYTVKQQYAWAMFWYAYFMANVAYIVATRK